MPHWELMYPSRYVKASDLEGRDARVVIKSIKLEELVRQGGQKEKKPVIRFENAEKALVLNKTNARLIAEQHGNDTADWKGKVITLYPTETQFGSDTVSCIRVRKNGQVGKAPGQGGGFLGGTETPPSTQAEEEPSPSSSAASTGLGDEEAIFGFVWTAAKKEGWDLTDLDKYVLERFGVQRAGDLTREQAQEAVAEIRRFGQE